jgi:hypothetical protein
VFYTTMQSTERNIMQMLAANMAAYYVRFELFMVVTMKKAVFWDVLKRL